MPKVVLRAPRVFETAFDQIRDELHVPRQFPFEVLSEAKAATLPMTDRVDARHLRFVAIDPPGSTDLDQAYVAEQLGDGFRVSYAIADVGAFIQPGMAVDAEARARGTTLYSPDDRTPLHPRILSEDRASLLPGGDKPALVWTIDLDGEANPVAWRLERAMVHTEAAITYAEAQRRIEAGSDPSLNLLATIGTLRQQREADRGGVSLSIPPQEVVERNGSYALTFGSSLPVEGWNAQISLLTGMVAAETMLEAGMGVLRTLPPADPEEVTRLRQTATALGLDWPAEVSYPKYVRSLEPVDGAHCAFLIQCTRVFRGAGYLGFASPDSLPDGDRSTRHSAIAANYAHVTAPLRRLVDRFANEILLAVFADRAPPAWALEALEELPSLMGRARQRESALDRAMLDMAEAVVLQPSVGESFPGLVINVNAERGQATVQISEPAIVASIPADGRTLGERVQLRLNSVDVSKRRVEFQVQA